MLRPWDRAKLEEEKRRRLPVETATVKRHFEALQSLKVDVIKQQRLEEATFIVPLWPHAICMNCVKMELW